MSSFLGLSTETWAIMLATVVGPLSAVLITRWRDETAQIRERRMSIFRKLMASRKRLIDAEHVSALNLVEVEFYGLTPVETAWRNYSNFLNNTPSDRVMTPTELQRWFDTRNDLLAKMLEKIGKELKFNLSEIDIRNGGYAPIAWDHRDEKLVKIQDFIVKLSEKTTSLPIRIFENQDGE